MIQEIGKRKFDNSYRNETADENSYIFAVENGKICIREDENGKLEVPKMSMTSIEKENLIYLFSIDDEKFFLVENAKLFSMPEGFSYESSRILRKAHPKHLSFAAATCLHLASWYETSRFCGRCGKETVFDKSERMKRCPSCGNMIFPRINPAVTVALIHEEKLLVAEYKGRPKKGSYALIAGFVEIGESLEECVQREVMEEVGLKAVNIRYFGSQPWGFAGNMQVGFTAEVSGDAEIVLDENELSSAFFISREEISYEEERPALTQELIEAFRKGEI